MVMVFFFVAINKGKWGSMINSKTEKWRNFLQRSLFCRSQFCLNSVYLSVDMNMQMIAIKTVLSTFMKGWLLEMFDLISLMVLKIISSLMCSKLEMRFFVFCAEQPISGFSEEELFLFCVKLFFFFWLILKPFIVG